MLPKVAAYQAIIFDGRKKPIFTEPTKKCRFVFDLFGVGYYDPKENKEGKLALRSIGKLVKSEENSGKKDGGE